MGCRRYRSCRITRRYAVVGPHAQLRALGCNLDPQRLIFTDRSASAESRPRRHGPSPDSLESIVGPDSTVTRCAYGVEAPTSNADIGRKLGESRGPKNRPASNPTRGVLSCVTAQQASRSKAGNESSSLWTDSRSEDFGFFRGGGAETPHSFARLSLPGRLSTRSSFRRGVPSKSFPHRGNVRLNGVGEPD